ncbi:MAG: alpha/beta hydrolase [Bacteroidales bacterium]|nr:alpha/beta hydrolase [Bacteroidales bacterium]
MKTFMILTITTFLGIHDGINAQDNPITKQTFTYTERDGYELKLDRYSNNSVKTEGKLPVIIYSFGGGWEVGSREDKMTTPFFHHFATLGYIVVSIDYRFGIKMAKEKGEFNDKNGVEKYAEAIQMGVEDLYDATAYILKHSDEWNIDKAKIVILGSSAGATNSNMAGYGICNRSPPAQKYLPEDFNYAGVISMAGAFWFKDTDTTLEWKQKPGAWMFFHGSKDQLVTYDVNHEGFAGYGPVYVHKHLEEMNSPYWFYDFPEADHIISATPMIDNWLEIETFLTKFIKEGQKLYIHTTEKGEVTKNFGNFMKLYGEFFKNLEAK